MNKPAQPNDKKKSGLSGAFSAFGGVIDDIVKEVKQDLREMTPEQKQVSAREQQLSNASSKVGNLLGSASAGLQENIIEGYTPPAQQAVAAAVAGPAGLPAGNLWHALRNPVHTATLRTDACYHALTAADIESYSRALHNETKAPYTLGVAAINFAALTDEDLAEGSLPAPDLLTQTLLKTIQQEPRLFGAVGAGPRQLWQNLQALDDYLTGLLNSNRKIIALGPVGLDEPFAPYTLPQQQAQLVLQLEIAAAFGIPAILSTRKTQEKLAETLGSLTELPPLIYLDPIVTPQDAELVQRFGMYALVRPEITAPEFEGKSYYRELPAEKLLLASGSALVAPHGFAGHFNQPKFLENSLATAAKLRGSNVNVLGGTVSANLVGVFGV